MGLGRKLTAVGLLLFSGFAAALDVGDKTPGVVLTGVGTKGEFLVSPVESVIKEPQSYTLIEFFQTESADSKTNLPILSPLAADLDVYVATRLVATNPENADVTAFVKNNQSDVTFPVMFDDRGDAQRAYGVTQVPTIFVVKDEATVVYKYTGAITPDVKARILTAVGYQPE